MDIQFKYPFEDVNVTVDCGGSRVDGPRVNIDIVNGAIDAKKSAVKITGEVHLHPFQAEPPDAIPGVEAMFDDVLADLDKLSTLLPQNSTEAFDLAMRLTLELRRLKDLSLTPVEHPGPAQTPGPSVTGDDPVREQAFAELVNLVFAKLFELTPRAWVHMSYSTTQADLISYKSQMVAQLKDSPTLKAILQSLVGPNYLTKTEG